MFVSKLIFALLVFTIVLTNALPMPHGRRGACRAHQGMTMSSSLPIPTTSPIPTPKVNIKDHTPPAVTDDNSSTATNEEATTYLGGESSTIPAKPVATQAPSTGEPANAKLSALFPIPSFLKSWSTSPIAEDALPLSDSTLQPTNMISALSPDYVPAPDGKKAMKAHYPKGSYTFTHEPQGGLSFYAPGPSSVDLSTAKEATFGYSVFFEEGFAFNRGGKLPGIYGGNSPSESIGCSGGSRSAACFSARLMWRGEGKGELYTYLPPYTEARFAANKKQCNVAPESDCNPTYGASVGRGAFKFTPGQWTTVSQRVRLNDVGQANGELELFVGGKSVISVGGLILRDSDAGRMRGIQMQTFFGGSSPDFASPKSQDAYFSDFSVAITDAL